MRWCKHAVLRQREVPGKGQVAPGQALLQCTLTQLSPMVTQWSPAQSCDLPGICPPLPGSEAAWSGHGWSPCIGCGACQSMGLAIKRQGATVGSGGLSLASLLTPLRRYRCAPGGRGCGATFWRRGQQL